MSADDQENGDETKRLIMGFRSATDSESEVIQALLNSGDYSCVTFLRGESDVWLGVAISRHDDDNCLHFAVEQNGPRIVETLLNVLMHVVESDTEGDMQIQGMHVEVRRKPCE